MEQSKIDAFLATHGKKFHLTHISYVTKQLERASDKQYGVLVASDFKSPETMLIFSCLGFGVLAGIDRMMLGQVGLGVLKLFSVFCFGLGIIWVIIDVFNIQNMTKEYNVHLFRKIMKLV